VRFLGYNKDDGIATPWEVYKFSDKYYIYAKGGALEGYGS